MKTLNEQVTRIKQMMGINESEIDLNTYKEETPILQDIKREGTSGEGNPIISMVINTYIPYNDDVNGDYKSGQSVKIKVVTEWKVYHTTHYRTPRETFSIKKCLDVTSDVNLTDNVIGSIKHIFREHTRSGELLDKIYGPYFYEHIKSSGVHTEHGNKIIDNIKQNKETLERLLLSNETPQEEIPQDNPIIDNNVSNNDTWASE
jgi:hypothetical protein